MITNLMLAFSLDVGSIIMLLVLLCLVALLVFGQFKRKKVDARLAQMRTDLKEGDKVMTDTGIMGVVVSKRTQDEINLVTIKTGEGEHVGYMEIHEAAIYYTFNKDGEPDFAGQNAELAQEKEDKEDKE